MAALAAVQASADRVARMTDIRVRGGMAALTDQLDAERAPRVDARASLVQATAQLTLDHVTLQKSLGLGDRRPRPGES